MKSSRDATLTDQRDGHFAPADHAFDVRIILRSWSWPASLCPEAGDSLNASTEDQRRELMPITRKYHLMDLMELVELSLVRGRN